MTSRRSIRSHQQRASRAFQFVPGHVGGRVASAQPVRRLGNISAQVDPEEVVVPEPGGCWEEFTQSANEASFTTGPHYVGVYGQFFFEVGDITFDGTPTDPEIRVLSATDVDSGVLDPLPGSWQAVNLAAQFTYFGWGWASGSVTDVVFEVRWTGTAQVSSFCPQVSDAQ